MKFNNIIKTVKFFPFYLLFGFMAFSLVAILVIVGLTEKNTSLVTGLKAGSLASLFVTSAMCFSQTLAGTSNVQYLF
ncbi:hypothetical protein AYY23_00235 [Photobacterium kishitanii]|nr:hypothetical protein AYY23_00235 [Photobacterium kishitanii]